MNAILIRIGVDAAYGRWNAPVDPRSLRFVYVPIPDSDKKRYRPGCIRTYSPFQEVVRLFYREMASPAPTLGLLPDNLLARCPHLDPDFDKLTYGDNGARRGSNLRGMGPGDLIVFYAGLRPVVPAPRLIYAIVGVYVIEQIVRAIDVLGENRDDNAHTRWGEVSSDDIVVRAKRGVSGRLECCIPIGEWRDRAYRVRHDLLKEWGGLTVKNGYIQRSARPPMFCNPKRFYDWFQQQQISLQERNNASRTPCAFASTV